MESRKEVKEMFRMNIESKMISEIFDEVPGKSFEIESAHRSQEGLARQHKQ